MRATSSAPRGGVPGRRAVPTARRPAGPALAAGLALLLVLPAGAAGPDSTTTARDGAMISGDSLRFTLHAPERVRPGEPVPIELRVTNVSSETVTLHLLGREIAFDIVVRHDDVVVWRRLEGEVVPQILQVRMLAPGETLALRDVWDQRTNAGRAVPPGSYSVRGLLPTDAPQPLATGTTLVRIG